MNIRARNGQVLAVSLLKQERSILESAQGICAIAAKTLAGERAGEAAAVAEENIALLRELLTAAPPAKLIPKE